MDESPIDKQKTVKNWFIIDINSTSSSVKFKVKRY